MTLTKRLSRCRLCADRFAATATGHAPRPVVWFQPGARILVVGQAPGMRVHETGLPFNDRSGDRLRDWMGVSRAIFYDRTRVAIAPMAFCFPGYDAKGSDLPPPKICAKTWRADVLSHIGTVRLTLVIGGYAQAWHFGLGPASPKPWRAGGTMCPRPSPCPIRPGAIPGGSRKTPGSRPSFCRFYAPV